jgi:hypothetical protein
MSRFARSLSPRLRTLAALAALTAAAALASPAVAHRG